MLPGRALDRYKSLTISEALSLHLLCTFNVNTYLPYVDWKFSHIFDEYVENRACQIDKIFGAGMMPRSPAHQNCTQIDCKSKVYVTFDTLGK